MWLIRGAHLFLLRADLPDAVLSQILPDHRLVGVETRPSELKRKSHHFNHSLLFSTHTHCYSKCVFLLVTAQSATYCGVLSGIVQYYAGPSGMSGQPFGHVVHLSVQDHPAVCALVVLRYLLPRVGGQRLLRYLRRRHYFVPPVSFSQGRAIIN